MPNPPFITFIIVNIYVLVGLNIILGAILYYGAFKDKLYRRKYQRTYDKISPMVDAYLSKEITDLNSILNTTMRYKVAVDILIEHVQKNNSDLRYEFENIGFFNKIKKLNIDSMKVLGLTKSPKAYKYLIKGINSKELEESFTCFYAISLLNLDLQTKNTVVEKLLKSKIPRDRQIDIVQNFNLPIKNLFTILEKVSDERAKVVLLRVIKNHPELLNYNYMQELLVYLSDTKEIKIATVLTLSGLKENNVVDKLIDHYYNEKDWEVRAAIAKSLVKFPYDKVKVVLKAMINDEQWWVRFNAIESIATFGLEGVDTLLELALDEDKKIADLAYSILNANTSINKTLESLEV